MCKIVKPPAIALIPEPIASNLTLEAWLVMPLVLLLVHALSIKKAVIVSKQLLPPNISAS